MKLYKDTIRTYYIEQPWTQPILSSNGILGGNSFAVQGLMDNTNGEEPYKAFDGIKNNKSNRYEGTPYTTEPTVNNPQGVIIYNPNRLNITNIWIQQDYGGDNAVHYTSVAGDVYGCDDGHSWKLLKSYTNPSFTTSLTIDMSDNTGFYKYYKITSTDCYSARVWCINEIELTATQLVPSSQQASTHYIDEEKLKSFTTSIRKYYKYNYSTFVQPTLSADGTLGGDSFAVYANQIDSSAYAFKAFDNNSSTYSQVYGPRQGYADYPNGYLTMYNPIPLQISSLTIVPRTGYCRIREGIFQGSKDNINWIDLYTINTTTISTATYNINSQDAYKYHRLWITSSDYTSNYVYYTAFTQINITAQERTVVESNSGNYDFYKDIYTYKALKSWEKGQYYGN